MGAELCLGWPGRLPGLEAMGTDTLARKDQLHQKPQDVWHRPHPPVSQQPQLEDVQKPVRPSTWREHDVGRGLTSQGGQENRHCGKLGGQQTRSWGPNPPLPGLLGGMALKQHTRGGENVPRPPAGRPHVRGTDRSPARQPPGQVSPSRLWAIGPH